MEWARGANIGTSDTSGTSDLRLIHSALSSKALDSYHMVLALGPAGTGKGYLSIEKALEALKAGDVQRLGR